MRLHPGETETIGWRAVTVLGAVRQLRDYVAAMPQEAVVRRAAA
ncbi:hypothetical protein [Streptomyces sp. NBC_00443]